ncbi:TonB-dependent receptor [Parasegetibacter sp. NRK P23]|uniref:TonB-dependent receptor n=1 Tax=Parasegetibacter sp. NRK P23 TaxID=2942999 RepID=UPI0020446231|nr:TonB-dependent receptor [Parasegetibacter sp. NRK P23]MCM5528503.1 outer membrane beta-barrel protein [Parasegetibacter sp. NRK P23]
MNKRISTLLIVVLVTFAKSSLFAQTKGDIRGVVISAETGKPLENATINVLLQKDSSTVGYKITDKKGEFSIANLNYGAYVLSLTFIGHEYKEVPFVLDKKSLLLDTVTLMNSAATLDEVVVSFKKPPMVVKEDTIEFNADSYKVKPEALAEDLLKKLPGIEVDRDGNITANGQQITQVYVDGKPFFGGDFKMATQNLPANILDKIQVVDKKTDKARFTKVDDGQREKIINITIKKDKRFGYFGRGNAGYGTDDRYNGRVTFNRFKGDRQISVFGSAGNINAGGRGDDQRASNGLNTNQRMGINYRNNYDKKLDIASSVSYGNNESITANDIKRQNVQTNPVLINDERQRGERNNKSFNWNADMEYKPDSMTEVRGKINATYGDNNNIQRNAIYLLRGFTDTSSAGYRNNFSNGNTLNFSGELNIMHRFKKERRSMTFGLTSNNGFSNNESIVNYFNEGTDVNGNPFTERRDQLTNNDSRNNRINLSFSYTEPIFKSNLIEFTYGYNWSVNNSDRETFDADNGKYDQLNDSLTNRFVNRSNNQRAGLKFVGIGKFYNYNFGVDMQDILQRNNNITKDSLVKQDFTNFLPSAGITFFNKKGRNINLFYNGEVRQPTLQQLQPVPDASDPLYQFSGNPDLKNEFTNNFNYKYDEVIRNSEININFAGSYSTTRDKIINNTVVDRSTGKRFVTPVNVNGVWQTGANLGYGMPIVKKVLRYSLSFGTNYNNGVSFVENKQNKLTNFNYNIGGRLNADVGEWLEFSYSTRFNRNSVKYSLQSNLNTVFYTNTHSFDISVEAPGGIELKSGFDIRENRGNTAQFNQTVSLLNAELVKHLMKRRMQISIQGFDLLNQNQNINRTVTPEFILDEVRNTLTRYFMLNIAYRFGKFGGGGGGRGPGGPGGGPRGGGGGFGGGRGMRM